MENIVITGATGFLGRNLAEYFLNRGDRVYALVRPDSANRDRLSIHENLILVPVGMERVLESTAWIKEADSWFHFAWGGVNREEIDSPAVQEKNIRCSLDSVEAAHLLGCKVFMDAGSRVEYGTPGCVMEESLDCQPVNEYGKAKLSFFMQAAVLCRQYGLNYVHLRFFSVYGYGDHPWSIISTLIRELRKGQSVQLSACSHEWNFLYIDDAVEAVVRLYEEGKHVTGREPEAVNIASRDTRVLKDFVEEVKMIVGGNGGLEYGTFVQAKEGALSIRPDIGRLMALTGGFAERYTFRRGIKTTIEKEKEKEKEMEHEHEEIKHTDSLL